MMHAIKFFREVAVVHMVCVLLGAPIVSKLHATFLFSCAFVASWGREGCGVEALVFGSSSPSRVSERATKQDDERSSCCAFVCCTNDGESNTTSPKHPGDVSCIGVDDHHSHDGNDGCCICMSTRHAVVFAVGTICWLTSVCSVLDWDVWWQEWPVPSFAALVVCSLVRIVCWAAVGTQNIGSQKTKRRTFRVE